MNLSNDIIISSGRGVFYFRHLQWDSDFFGRRSYILDMEKSIFKPNTEIKAQIINNFIDSFITAKINTGIGIEIISFLQECGFYYVETEVRLRHVANWRKEQKICMENITIEKLNNAADIPCELLGRTFVHTRFHTDFHIDNLTADRLWISYLKNYRPSPTGHLFAAKTSNEIIGSIIVNISGHEATLFFVAVIDKFRNKGIGSILINKVIDSFKDYDIFTGTQIKNISALNFYIKNGFTAIDSTKTILHYWGAVRNV